MQTLGSQFSLFALVFFAAMVVIFCHMALPVGKGLRVMDEPDGGRKKHARATPMVGGIALMIPLLVVAVVESYRWAVATGDAGMFVPLVVSGVVFLALGWYDDSRNAKPTVRLAISAGVFGALALIEPSLMLTRVDLEVLPPWILGPLALPFTMLCLVGLQNAANMVDGMNGLLIGLSLFWVTCLLGYAPPQLFLFLTAMFVGLWILLIYNLRGNLFLGDAGSYAIGATVGILMIACYQSSGGALPMLTVVLWLLVPVLDCLRVMVVRFARGRSPLTADRDHLHHRLERHLHWPICLSIYLALVVVPGFIGARWPQLSLAMIVATLAGYGSLMWATRSRRVMLPQMPESVAEQTGGSD